VSQNAPTLAQVAAHAGVSLATASRALNGSTRKVNPELQERVLASASALGYSANVQAQAVAAVARATAEVLGELPPRRQPPKADPPLRRPEVRARLARS